MTDDDATSEATADAGQESTVNTGDRYRLADDGTVFEVVGVTGGEVEVVQYDAAGDRQGKYTISIEEFRSEIADPAE